MEQQPRSATCLERSWRRRVAPLALVAVLVAAAGFAATTSRLTGTVVDSDGLALPGVTVILTSDVLIGGQQIAISDADGSFGFSLLPPGQYFVKAELSGFQPTEAEARVALDRATQVRMTMVPAEFTGEIEVTAEVPVVDTTRVNAGESYNEQFLQAAAVGSAGRNYLTVIGNEAGSVGTGNVNVFGSVGSDNVWLVDGLNTTDPVTATFGTNFNYDAIQEVSIQTGGYDAEFGQALGGVVNLVTKSGGNEFHGALDVRYQDEGFAESGDHFDPDEQDSKFQQYAGTLGGPISRDRLWFFVSVQNGITDTQPTGSAISREFSGIDYIGKLTWQASDAHRLVFKISGDPAEIDNAHNLGVLPFVEPEAAAYQEQGGEIYQAELNSVLSDSLLLTAQIGVNQQSLDGYPMSGDFDTPGVYNFDTGVYSVNYGNVQLSDRDSQQYKAALSWFVDDLAGAHEIKGGLEFRRLEFSGNNYSTGNQAFNYLDPEISDLPDGDVNGDGLIDYILYNNDPRFADIVESQGDLVTAFVQDVWRPVANLTIRPGVRYDGVTYDNQAGTTVADFYELQPRIGFAWDILGDGKNVLRANVGRFMHPASVNLADTVDGRQLYREVWIGYEYWCGIGYCDTDFLDGVFGPGEEFVDPYGNTGLYYFNQDIGGAPFETVDTLGVGSLEAQYADQYIIGYERQLWSQTSLELQYVNKQTRDLIEDTCNNNTWAWGASPQPDLDDESTWTDPGSCSGFVLANLDMLERDYEAWIAKFETRYKDFFVLANYTFATSEGNTEAQANQSYASGGYDEYPRDFYNFYGKLSDDREHRVKVNGYVLLPLDFTVGFDFFWSSAVALDYTANCGTLAAQDPADLAGLGLDPDIARFCNGQTGGTLFLEERGSRRADNDRYELDLQLTKGFDIGAVNLQAIVAVQNVFSSEQGTTYQEREFSSPAWGTPTTYSQPRRYELGFRLEF